jgi:hypothetical protein
VLIALLTYQSFELSKLDVSCNISPTFFSFANELCLRKYELHPKPHGRSVNDSRTLSRSNHAPNTIAYLEPVHSKNRITGHLIKRGWRNPPQRIAPRANARGGFKQQIRQSLSVAISRGR